MSALGKFIVVHEEGATVRAEAATDSPLLSTLPKGTIGEFRSQSCVCSDRVLFPCAVEALESKGELDWIRCKEGWCETLIGDVAWIGDNRHRILRPGAAHCRCFLVLMLLCLFFSDSQCCDRRRCQSVAS